MKVILLIPMEIESEKALDALRRYPNLKKEYQIIVTGIGRESIAKAMMQLPPHDVCVLLGFAAIVGQEHQLSDELKLGMPVEITNARRVRPVDQGIDQLPRFVHLRAFARALQQSQSSRQRWLPCGICPLARQRHMPCDQVRA